MDRHPLNNSDNVYQQMMDALVSNQRANPESSLSPSQTVPIDHRKSLTYLQTSPSLTNNKIGEAASTAMFKETPDGSIQNIPMMTPADSTIPPTLGQSQSTAYSLSGPTVCLNIPEYGLVRGNLIKTPDGKLILSSATTKDNRLLNISLNPRMISSLSHLNQVQFLQSPQKQQQTILNNIKLDENAIINQQHEFQTSPNKYSAQNDFNVVMPGPITSQMQTENSILNFASCLNSNSIKPNNPSMIQKNSNHLQLTKADSSYVQHQQNMQNMVFDQLTSSVPRLRPMFMDRNFESSMPSLVPVVTVRNVQPAISPAAFYQPIRMGHPSVYVRSDSHCITRPNIQPAIIRSNVSVPSSHQDPPTSGTPAPMVPSPDNIKCPLDLFTLELKNNYIKKHKSAPSPAFVDMIHQMWDALPIEQKNTYIIKFKKLSSSSSISRQSFDEQSSTNAAKQNTAKKRKLAKTSQKSPLDEILDPVNKMPQSDSMDLEIRSRISLTDKPKSVPASEIIDSVQIDKKPSNIFTDILFDSQKLKQNALGSSFVTTSNICLNKRCTEAPKFSRERGGSIYCSNECLIAHCCFVFENMFP